jgi:DNA-directed RNA polymerase III subunit RPC2
MTGGGRQFTRIDETIDILKNVFLAHIPVSKNMPFFAKCRYLALMIRRIIEASQDPSKLDDKDYYGNKRLELAGQLVSLLFEDLFKRFQFEFKKQIDIMLPRYAGKKNREPFDALTCLRPDIITKGLEIAISSGNWSLKRFKMER